MKFRVYFLMAVLAILFSGKLQAQSDCSTCSVRKLYAASLSKRTFFELNLLKAELYARHGYTFKSQKWIDYFSEYDWYTPLHRNTLISLNEIEKENVTLINQAIKAKLQAKIRPEDSAAKRLSRELIDKYFSNSVRSMLRLTSYNIDEVYLYNDKTGEHALVLASIAYDPYEEGDIFNESIKISFCDVENERFMFPEYEVTDLGLLGFSELDIRFPTQYVSLDDLDGDGFSDPIVAYVTMRGEGYRNGWIKIIVRHKEQQTTIYAVSSTNLGERAITATSGYYSLPQVIKEKVKDTLSQMQQEEFVFLPADWEEKL